MTKEQILTHEIKEVSCLNHPQNLTLFNLEGGLKTLNQIEIEAIKNALEYTNNNITLASKLLGIAKSTFYRKVKELNLKT